MEREFIGVIPGSALRLEPVVDQLDRCCARSSESDEEGPRLARRNKRFQSAAVMKYFFIFDAVLYIFPTSPSVPLFRHLFLLRILLILLSVVALPPPLVRTSFSVSRVDVVHERKKSRVGSRDASMAAEVSLKLIMKLNAAGCVKAVCH